MKYIVEYHKIDARRYLRAYNSYRFYKYTLRSRIYESIVAALAGALVFSLSRHSHSMQYYIFGPIFVMVIMFLIYPYYCIIKGYILISWRDKAVPDSLRYEIELTEKGVCITGDLGDVLWKWDTILKVSEYKQLFIFEFKDKRLQYIPLNGFASFEMAKTFSEQLFEMIRSQQSCAPDRRDERR